MIDPDLQKQLQEINTNLTQIKQNSKRGIWRAFFNGMFSALGYVAGIALIVVVLGWVLRKSGLWEPFKQEVKAFGNLIQNAQKLIGPGDVQSASSTQNSATNKASEQGSTLITLPNGQQIRVNLPQN